MSGDLVRVPVSGMFCHAVYGATHAINQNYLPLLKEVGLTYPQYITLLILEETDGLSVGQVSDRLKMTTSTVTPLLKRLEKLNYVVRQRQKDDERKVLIFLTDAGRHALRQAPAITACMTRLTGLSEKGLLDLVRLLDQLTRNLSRRELTHPGRPSF